MKERTELGKITHKINALAIILDYHANEILKKHYGIGYTEFLTLVGLHYLPNPSQKDLVQFTLLSKSMVSKTIKRMENMGLVSKFPNPADNRNDIVSFTESGRKLMALASEQLERIFLENVYKIKGIDLVEFEKGLDVLLKNLAEWKN